MSLSNTIKQNKNNINTLSKKIVIITKLVLQKDSARLCLTDMVQLAILQFRLHSCDKKKKKKYVVNIVA